MIKTLTKILKYTPFSKTTYSSTRTNYTLRWDFIRIKQLDLSVSEHKPIVFSALKKIFTVEIATAFSSWLLKIDKG
jgi:hypothetical protein